MTNRTQAQTQTEAMSCVDFQENLPDLFAASGGVPSDPTLQGHLATCKNCSSLVRDLQYIAQEARRLFEPANDATPSDDVWSHIKDRMDRESNG